jgi:chromate transporter
VRSDVIAAGPRPPLTDRGITLGALFCCFLLIGITGFGGVLPVVVHELVRKRAWLDTDEFTEILSICQVLPGPNIVNISVLFGSLVAGPMGGVVSITGLLLLPVALVLVLGTLYAGVSDVAQVQGAMHAVAAGAAGLLMAVTARLFWPRRRNPMVLVIGSLVVIAVAWFRVPLVWVILLFGPLSLGLTYLGMRRDG